MKHLSLTLAGLAGLLLAGCATPLHTAARPVVHHPAARQTASRPPAGPVEPAVTTPALAAPAASGSAATKVSAPEPGSAIPFMGFRPMRGQTASGA